MQGLPRIIGCAQEYHWNYDAQSRRRDCGSKPVVASSRKSTFGSCMSALAIIIQFAQVASGCSSLGPSFNYGLKQKPTSIQERESRSIARVDDSRTSLFRQTAPRFSLMALFPSGEVLRRAGFSIFRGTFELWREDTGCGKRKRIDLIINSFYIFTKPVDGLWSGFWSGCVSVRNALLGLLEQRPRHGYELHAAFEALAGGEANWDVKPAQIYSTLSRLAEKGLVEETGMDSEVGSDRRVFAITSAGRRELYEWLSAPVRTKHQRDEFFLKLMLSLATGADPHAVIYAQRANLFKELHRMMIQRDEVDPNFELFRILMLDRVIMHLEADLRWLALVESRLDEIKSQPAPEPKVRSRGRPPKNG